MTILKAYETIYNNGITQRNKAIKATLVIGVVAILVVRVIFG